MFCVVCDEGSIVNEWEVFCVVCDAGSMCLIGLEPNRFRALIGLIGLEHS